MNEDKKTKYKIIGIYRVRLIISYFSCLLFINKFYLNIFFLNKIPILFSDCNTYKLFLKFFSTYVTRYILIRYCF